MIKTSKVLPKPDHSKADLPVGAKSSNKVGVKPLKPPKPSKLIAKRLNKESKLLDPVEINNVISNSSKPNVVFTNPTTEIDFSHNYITDDLNCFNVGIGECDTCCPAMKILPTPNQPSRNSSKKM